MAKALPVLDEDGEQVSNDGGPPTGKILAAIEDLNIGPLDKDQKKNVRKLKRAALALIEARGEGEPSPSGLAANMWVVSAAANEDGEAHRLGYIVGVTGDGDVAGFELRRGREDFRPIRNGRDWVEADMATVEQETIDLAIAQGVIVKVW
jgi:hypothetical protein